MKKTLLALTVLMIAAPALARTPARGVPLLTKRVLAPLRMGPGQEKVNIDCRIFKNGVSYSEKVGGKDPVPYNHVVRLTGEFQTIAAVEEAIEKVRNLKLKEMPGRAGAGQVTWGIPTMKQGGKIETTPLQLSGSKIARSTNKTVLKLVEWIDVNCTR